MSLSTNLARGRDHDERAGTHVKEALDIEVDALCQLNADRPATMIRDVYAARLEWAMAVCALLAWVRYGEGKR